MRSARGAGDDVSLPSVELLPVRFRFERERIVPRLEPLSLLIELPVPPVLLVDEPPRPPPLVPVPLVDEPLFIEPLLPVDEPLFIEPLLLDEPLFIDPVLPLVLPVEVPLLSARLPVVLPLSVAAPVVDEP